MDDLIKLQDASIIFFLLGYLIHFSLKSTIYPDVYNFPTILRAYILGYLCLVAFCFYTSNFHLISSLISSSILNSCWITGFCTSLLLNRLIFSPLTAYPGPLLAKISKFWLLSIYPGGRRSHILQSLFEKYGTDFLRVAPNDLLIRSVEGAHAMWGVSMSFDSIIEPPSNRLI
jgi:hypothetical protein